VSAERANARPSADGCRSAGSSADHTIRLWDARKASACVLQVDTGHWLCALALSPDGEHLAVNALPGKVCASSQRVGERLCPPAHNGRCRSWCLRRRACSRPAMRASTCPSTCSTATRTSDGPHSVRASLQMATPSRSVSPSSSSQHPIAFVCVLKRVTGRYSVRGRQGADVEGCLGRAAPATCGCPSVWSLGVGRCLWAQPTPRHALLVRR
jgi:hypothetical protein